jgi:hypothetical protein
VACIELLVLSQWVNIEVELWLRKDGLLTASKLQFGAMPTHVQEREDTGMSEWDRFGRTEYVRLAMEEEGDEITDADGGPDVWAAQGFDMS